MPKRGARFSVRVKRITCLSLEPFSPSFHAASPSSSLAGQALLKVTTEFYD
jgi:hypothetical protein